MSEENLHPEPAISRWAALGWGLAVDLLLAILGHVPRDFTLAACLLVPVPLGFWVLTSLSNSALRREQAQKN